MNLEALQRSLFDAIATDSPLKPDTLDTVVVGGALSPQSRVEIYAEMYWLRMRDTLRADFPATVRQMGEEAFDVAAAKYVQQFPSTHFSLGSLGRQFADFLYSLSPQVSGAIADLAAFEWARGQAFIAIDGPTLSLAEFATVAQSRFAEARLQLDTSVRLLTLKHDVRPALDAALPLELEPRAAHWVVWRKDLVVFHAEIAENELRALQLAAASAPLPDLCECFVDAADPVTAAFQAIGSWVTEGMVGGVSVDL